MANFLFNSIQINSSWTLFLDRDGVINENKPNEYILSPEEFIFKTGAKAFLKKASSIFNRIIIVTNQQGIAKSLMTEEDLNNVHKYMLSEIEKSGGKIDAIFFGSEYRDSAPFHRKPNPYMGLEAKKLFPEIDFETSIMIGDSESDMEFADNLGMRKIKITNDLQLMDIEILTLN